MIIDTILHSASCWYLIIETADKKLWRGVWDTPTPLGDSWVWRKGVAVGATAVTPQDHRRITAQIITRIIAHILIQRTHKIRLNFKAVCTKWSKGKLLSAQGTFEKRLSISIKFCEISTTPFTPHTIQHTQMIMSVTTQKTMRTSNTARIVPFGCLQVFWFVRKASQSRVGGFYIA